MPIQAIINGSNVNIANQDEISFDFTIENESVNATFLQDINLEFVDELNNSATELIDRQININSLMSDIECSLTNNSDFLAQGRLIPAMDSNQYATDPKQYSISWKPENSIFFERAKNLDLKTFVNESDYKKVRYIREDANDYLQSALIALSIYVMAQQTIEQTKATIQTIKEAIPTVFGTAADLGPAIRAIFNVILQLVVLALTIVALNELLKQLSEALFAKPKAYNCLNFREVFIAGCSSLGYNFKSSLFDGEYKNLDFLLKTSEKGVLNGKPTNNPVPDTSLLTEMEKVANIFNLQIRIQGKTVILEPMKFFRDQTPNNIQLGDFYSNGTYAYNLQELVQKISIQFDNPNSDPHYKEDKYSVNFIPKKINLKNYGINNSIEVVSPYTKPNRKNSQSDVDKLFNSIFDLFAGLNKEYQIKGGERIGYMLLQADLVPSDSFFIRSGEKISTTTYDKLGAKYIYDSYWETEAPYNRLEYIITGRKETQIPIQQVYSLSQNNNIRDIDGKKLRVSRVSYNEMEGSTEIEGRKKVSNGDLGFITKNDFTIIYNIK